MQLNAVMVGWKQQYMKNTESQKASERFSIPIRQSSLEGRRRSCECHAGTWFGVDWFQSSIPFHYSDTLVSLSLAEFPLKVLASAR